MIKDIEKMLKYQEVDMKLYRLERDLKNADVTKSLMEAMSSGKELKEKLANASRDIDNEKNSIAKAQEDFATLIQEATDLENSISDNANIEQIDYFLKKIDDLLKKIKDVENISGDSKKVLEKLSESGEKDYKQMVMCAKAVGKYKPEFEKLKSSMQVEVTAINQQLKEIIKKEGIDLEGKVYKVYKATAKRKMPVFVELSGNNCGGCGVDVPESVINATNENGYAECPNCGRIIYKK